MLHGSHSKGQIVTGVLTSGYVQKPAKGQLAFVKNKAVKGQGTEVVSDFAGMSKKDKIAIRVGIGDVPNNLRTSEVPYAGTGYFPLENILEIKSHIPSQVKLKVSHLEVGYDGINADSGLYIPEGKSAVLDIMVYGQVASTFFGDDEYVISKQVYRKVGETMQEVIRRVVKELQEDPIPTGLGWASVTDEMSQFLEFGVIDSSNVALAGTDWVFSTIQVKDSGDSNDLAVVQSSYPAYKVKRTAREDGVSTYTILHPTANALSNLTITDVNVKNKDCADCLAGYSLLTGGTVYSVSLEDDGTDQTALVDNLPGYVTGTVIKVGNDNGVGTYSIVLDNALTNAEKTAFLASNAIASTASFTELGEVKDVCKKTATTTYTWSNGQTCKTSTKGFSIVLPDTECGTTRLAELQAAYPELTILESITVGGCKRKYTTTVVTNLVCDQCDEIYLQPFVAKEPEAFENTEWQENAIVYDEDAKMGIFVKGKPFYITPEAYEEDFIPYVETSLKVKSISFGAKGSLLLNFDGNIYDPSTEFSEGRVIQYAQDVDNNAQALFGYERMSNRYFTNREVHKANLFARANMSQERLLKYDKKYVHYSIKYIDNKLSQGGASRSDLTHEFRMVVEYGKHTSIQNILNKLAGKLGLESVNIL